MIDSTIHLDQPTLSTQVGILVQGILLVIGAIVAIFGGKKH